MAYVAGDKITTSEYNGLLLTDPTTPGINHLIGSGELFHGLGEVTIPIISTGQEITATQWNSLFTAMDNLANHTNDTLTSTSQRSTGDLIEIKSALTADLATLAASVTIGASTSSSFLERHFAVRAGTVIRSLAPTITNTATDVVGAGGANGTVSNVTVDFTTNQFFIVSIQPASASDSCSFMGGFITNFK